MYYTYVSDPCTWKLHLVQYPKYAFILYGYGKVKQLKPGFDAFTMGVRSEVHNYWTFRLSHSMLTEFTGFWQISPTSLKYIGRKIYFAMVEQLPVRGYKLRSSL